MTDHNPIYVTEPFLPPIEEYIEQLRGIWERNVLTNNGPLVQELEQKLQAHHGTNRRVTCVANGGLGLQIILKAMGIGGEIITTPFSYVATASCPLWEGCRVRFADIEPTYLTIDPDAVEAAITPQTEAILATHLFGNPCDLERLQAIADRHGLALIYDAAHAFGVTYKGRSILEYGDAAMVSLHATKIFHTVEGGFLAFKDPQQAEKAEWMRRYAHHGPGKFHGIGINAKMSELHAAMGLTILPHLDEIYRARKQIVDAYRAALADCQRAACIPHRTKGESLVAYAPIRFQQPAELDQFRTRLLENNIHPRRYFKQDWQTVANLANPGTLPVFDQIQNKILCLPINTRHPVEPILEVLQASLC
ncbi:MAG: DegT/DnrJ/EryC1/StrS family aminotransferase [Opitutales bacterium]